MENVVPGTLQRLRAADIIRMAGLTAASLGQEYCRTSAVHSTHRQGARISGIIEPMHAIIDSLTEDGGKGTHGATRYYPVEVEILSPTTWVNSCPCSLGTSTLCSHAAALLYQWLARPASFVVSTPSLSTHEAIQPVSREFSQASAREAAQELLAHAKPLQPVAPGRPSMAQRGPSPLGNLMDILTQLGLSELRNIAREYEIISNGMNKQQLTQTILETLQHPEAVRRVATTLEKAQRQLLAAITIAGGSVTDDDLRGLFERFSLGQPSQLQHTLVALQNKALLLRTSLNSGPQQRIGLSGALLDIGWFVPPEIQAALRVTVPTTVFSTEPDEKGTAPTIQLGQPYTLLADLLLAARALDGYHLAHNDEWQARATDARPPDTFSYPRLPSPLSAEGSVPIPPPADLPSPALLNALQAVVHRSPAFLRFAVCLIRLADILHKDDNSASSYLRALPNAAQLLLGPGQAEVAHDLFELWLTQSSYEELSDLQEEGLRLRCRSTALNFPVLRPGEMDAENSEARQWLVALLAQVPLNQWVSFPAFARFVYRLNPLFLQKRQRLFSSPHWWIEHEDGRPLRPLQLSDWLRAESYYLAHLLCGPLHWWGACDLALSPEQRLLAFRLTPMAGWFLTGQALEQQPPAHDHQAFAEALEVVDDEELLVTCSTTAWPLIELLETFTQAAGVRNGRLRYRLTPKALGEALGRGLQPALLLDMLRSVATHTSQPVNSLQCMLAQLERWIANYGRARIYTGVTLLETADNMVMRELSAITSLDAQVVQTIHPTLLILKKQGAQQVVDELKRRAQSPLLHDEDMYGTG